MTVETTERKIVVGIDGSDASKDALRTAARYAELSDAALHAVIAWHLPEIYAYVARDYAADARTTLEQSIDDVLGRGAHNKVTLHVEQGGAAAVLMAQCDGAEMLVVGSRGHGGFAGMLLGSVAQHVVQHACCPVLVVR